MSAASVSQVAITDRDRCDIRPYRSLCRFLGGLERCQRMLICVPFYSHPVDAYVGDRRGTVFIVIESAEVAATPHRYVFGYWDGAPDDDAEGLIESLPDALTPDEAIDWARRRSGRVLIRNDDPTFPLPTGRYLWAGDAACPPDVQPMP